MLTILRLSKYRHTFILEFVDMIGLLDYYVRVVSLQHSSKRAKIVPLIMEPPVEFILTGFFFAYCIYLVASNWMSSIVNNNVLFGPIRSPAPFSP